MPNIDDELFEQFIGCSIEFGNGFLQVSLTEEAKQKAALITPDKFRQFTRMIFELMNAPYEFTRLMSGTLGKLKNDVTLCVMDEIFIGGKDIP